MATLSRHASAAHCMLDVTAYSDKEHRLDFSFCPTATLRDVDPQSSQLRELKVSHLWTRCLVSTGSALGGHTRSGRLNVHHLGLLCEMIIAAS